MRKGLAKVREEWEAFAGRRHRLQLLERGLTGRFPLFSVDWPGIAPGRPSCFAKKVKKAKKATCSPRSFARMTLRCSR